MTRSTVLPSLSLSERLCLAYVNLSRSKHDSAAPQSVKPRDPLRLFKTQFPNMVPQLRGKAVIDFGCAKGDQTFALAESGASPVLGVEVLTDRLRQAIERRENSPLKEQISFAQNLTSEHDGKFDYAISINTFEHLSDPMETLQQIYDALKPGGRLLMTFGPLWYSAYGPHQLELTQMPWTHLLFRERAYMKVRGLLLNDPEKKTYADRWLNQMSVARFEDVMERCPFQVESASYGCSWGLKLFSGIPILRELVINMATCTLRK